MEQTIFAGREQEVQDVMAFARKGLAGEVSVGFVTGEAGMGKTALVEEVFRRLKAEVPDLVMAVGRCNVDSASYLPFRTIPEDVLESRTDVQLSGELAAGKKARMKDSVLSIIKDVGADVMGIFLPSTIAAIAGKGSKSLFDKWFGSDAKKDLAGMAAPRDLEQVQVFGWYTRVMENIAAKFPVLLFVDDLHWADASSLNLLLYLGRETVEDRLILIGTYRPHEVAPDSLLAQNKTKLGRYGAQEFPLDLSETKASGAEKARQFVHDYLLAKYHTNFSERFEALLADRTEGNALFLTEILKNMEEKGEIIVKKSDASDMSDTSDRGSWQLTREMTHLDELPERVENAIKERIGRLEKHLREILDYASVEGDEFIAQVIARVRQLEEWQLIDDLTEKLQRIHQLIYERGGTSLPNGDRVHGFVFKHNLIREYVYAQLPQTKKELLHAKIGDCLERLYAPETGAIAAELAIHFTQAHVPDKAVKYCLHAAQDANARYGAAEAVNFAQMGLDALEQRAKTLSQPEYAETKIRLFLELAKAEENGGDPQEQKDHIQAGIDYLENNLVLLSHVSEVIQAEVFAQIGKLQALKDIKKAEAKKYLEKALAIYERQDDKKNIAELLYQLGNVYPYIATPETELTPDEKGIEAIKKSLIIGNQLQNIELQVRCLSRLAEKYQDKDNQLTTQYASQAFELASNSDTFNRYVKVQALTTVAKYGMLKSKIAIEYLQQALQLAREIGDVASEADILQSLGDKCVGYVTLQKEAQEFRRQSLTIREKIGLAKGWSLVSVGSKLGKSKVTEEYYQQAIKESDERRHSVYRGWLGVFYTSQENYAQAEIELLKRVEILKKYRATDLIGLTRLAQNAVYWGKYEDTRKYIEIAKTLLPQEIPFRQARFSREISDVYRLLGELETAKNNCQQALDWLLTNAEDPEDLVAVAEARLIMGKILVDMEDYQDAITYLEKAQTAFEICQHYALGETLLYLGKAHLGLGGVVFRRQAQDYVIKALAEFQRLELRHKEKEAQELLHALS